MAAKKTTNKKKKKKKTKNAIKKKKKTKQFLQIACSFLIKKCIALMVWGQGSSEKLFFFFFGLMDH